MERWNDVAVDIERPWTFFLWSKDETMTPHKKAAQTKGELDAATERLFKNAPRAAAIEKEARKHRRTQARKEWWAQHGTK